MWGRRGGESFRSPNILPSPNSHLRWGQRALARLSFRFVVSQVPKGEAPGAPGRD
jgi:hypothetical protein